MAEAMPSTRKADARPAGGRPWALLAIVAGMVNGAILVLGPPVAPEWQAARIGLQVLISVACIGWGLRHLGLLSGMLGRRRQTVRLTLPAIGALAIMMVLFAGSLIGRSNPLMLVASMIAGPFVVNGWLAHGMLRRMESRRRVPERTAAGQPVWIEVEVTNRKRWLASWLVVLRDEIRSNEESLTAEVPFLRTPAGETRIGRYQFLPMRRGLHRFESMSLTTSYPFGFVERSLVVDCSDEMIVHPRIGRLTRRWRRTSTTKHSPIRSAANREGTAEDEFQRLREYRFGDSTRHIHWRTSARRSELLVREIRSDHAAPVVVLLDLWQLERPSESDLERVELAVSFAATVCVDELTRHREATLDVLVSSRESPRWEGRSGPAGVEALLDALAVVEGSPSASLGALASAIEATAWNQAAVLLVSTRSSEEIDRLVGDLSPEQRRMFDRARVVECSPETLEPLLSFE